MSAQASTSLRALRARATVFSSAAAILAIAASNRSASSAAGGLREADVVQMLGPRRLDGTSLASALPELGNWQSLTATPLAVDGHVVGVLLLGQPNGARVVA